MAPYSFAFTVLSSSLHPCSDAPRAPPLPRPSYSAMPLPRPSCSPAPRRSPRPPAVLLHAAPLGLPPQRCSPAPPAPPRIRPLTHVLILRRPLPASYPHGAVQQGAAPWPLDASMEFVAATSVSSSRERAVPEALRWRQGWEVRGAVARLLRRWRCPLLDSSFNSMFIHPKMNQIVLLLRIPRSNVMVIQTIEFEL